MQRFLPKLTAPAPSAAWLLLHALGCTPTTGSIGAVLGQARDGGQLTVREAPPGYPAAQTGIGPGDEVLLIDGRDVRAMSPEAIHLALEGEVGSTVNLTILRRGKIERIALRRAPLAR